MKIHCLVFLIVTAVFNDVYSQSADVSLDSPITLPGHLKRIEELVKADDVHDIVLASFVSLGIYAGSDSPGEKYYDQAEIKIIESYKGNMTGTAQHVAYSVFNFLAIGYDSEARPILVTKYIMFIVHPEKSSSYAARLVLATDKNIARIKTLLASGK